MDNDIFTQAKAQMVKTGEVKILRKINDVAWTVLGPCISVIFHVPNKISLISHTQFPSELKYKRSSQYTPACVDNGNYLTEFKYVDQSVEYMINKLLKNKINLNDVHTSLMGGACSIMGIEENNPIGYQNVETAKNILDKYKIRINREHTGGTDGITIWFYHNGNKLIINKHKEEGKIIFNDLKSLKC